MSDSMSEDPPVVVYTTDWCGYCERAKGLLEARGIAYREVYVPRSPEGRARLAEVSPTARTFPQIVVEGEPIGGYRELVAVLRSGELDRLNGS